MGDLSDMSLCHSAGGCMSEAEHALVPVHLMHIKRSNRIQHHVDLSWCERL